MEEVKANFARYGLLDEQVVFVKGFFDQTLPDLSAGPFALLRLDGDMYTFKSTIVALEALYPRLSPGGFIIVDDYGAVEGCRLAVDDFRRTMGIIEPLEVIDWTGVWWRKPKLACEKPEAEMLETSARNAAHVEHLALAETFVRRCTALGLKPDPLLFWYHTIDLGDGLVTPGSFDYRATIEQFGFPADMSGMTALDVGSATGFFAFELERPSAPWLRLNSPHLRDGIAFPASRRPKSSTRSVSACPITAFCRMTRSWKPFAQ